MGDAQSAQGALELAARITVFVTGTRAKEAQGVGVDGLGQSMAFECAAEMSEVVPGRIALHEAAGHAHSRAVVSGQHQGLLGRARPPLVDGAVVLPEIADALRQSRILRTTSNPRDSTPLASSLNPLPHSEIRFCSVSLSGFEPAPTIHITQLGLLLPTRDAGMRRNQGGK